ncbi:MAG TPA: flagellar biosynthesis protein FlgA, partial [Alphaproteobacteria bacterium]|nr:flagellar biosynthesis protein FlgA [Alphaproteobacteria bacterium]
MRFAKPFLALALAIAGLFVLTLPAHAQTRIKDIADVEGVRENQLVGYGLVVGLDGSGDSLRNAA